LVDRHAQRLLRLAALCHDIGHGLMSHVSENALVEFDAIEDLLNDAKAEFGDDKALGELNSAILIGSPAFAQLLAVAQDKTHDHIDVPELATRLSDAVLGRVVWMAAPTLQELVTGPFDG